jgi:hypothetical protein
MFPFYFTSFNGLKSIIAKAWNPFLNYVDSVFDLITNDLVTFLLLVENAPPLIVLGLVAFANLCCSNQKMFSSYHD